MRICLCELGSERVAIPVEAVEEVFSLGQMIEVPGAPPWVIGATSRRGQVVPIVEPIADETSGTPTPVRTPLPSGQPMLTLRVDDLLAAIPIDATHGIHEGEIDPEAMHTVICDANRWTLLSPETLARRWREALARWATP